MSNTLSLLLPVSIILISYGLTGRVLAYAIRKSMIDHPDYRSSHAVPTPRGGGLAIVMMALASFAILPLLFSLPVYSWLPLLLGGGITAVIGFKDDHGHIPARWRLLTHFTAAISTVIALGGLPELTLAGYPIPPLLILIAVLPAMVWLLNLYNFMDGINGIAGIQAMTTGMALAILFFSHQTEHAIWLIPATIAAASAGFLFWNFPTARIFMGDAGSGFLGITFAGLILIAGKLSSELFWSALILMAVFITDATLTLIRRALRRKALYEAHRSHGYQYASRRYDSHSKVSLCIGMINLFWLCPLAYAVSQSWIQDLTGLLLAYLPLLILALCFHAGAEEKQEQPLEQA